MNMFSRLNNWLQSFKAKILMAALLETLFVSFFTLLPVIIGVVFLQMNSSYKDMEVFYMRGEFFLYSLSLFVSSHLVFNQYKAKPWDLHSAFSRLAMIFLVLCAIIYATIATLTTPNKGVIELLSWISMGIAVPLFFYSQFVSNRNTPDVSNIRRGEQQSIEDSLS